MKAKLITTLSLLLVGTGSLIGTGTYALFTATASNGSNDFSSMTAETLHLESAVTTDESSTQMRSFAFTQQSTQVLPTPMFYSHADFPSGLHPYDYNTHYLPDNESPGGFAPGDSVTRTMSISNAGSAAKLTEIQATLQGIKDRNGIWLTPGTPAYEDFLTHMQLKIYSPENNYTTPVYTGSFKDITSGTQPLNTVMNVGKGCSSYVVKFVASMDLTAGNDVQGLKGIVDFALLAGQCRNNWFDPPFSHDEYCMQYKSVTPIKFEYYDCNDSFVPNPNSNVSLVITGPNLGSGVKFTLGNGLTCNGGHYQVNFDSSQYPLVVGATYTASVYDGNQLCGQKSFPVTPPGGGSRAN